MKRLLVGILTLGAALADAAVEFKTVQGIPYYSSDELASRGAYAANRCLLDVRYPLGVTNFATVINLHGGGLVAGNRHFAPWPKPRQDRDPVAFVGVGYRLMTNATPVECVSDAAHAVAWTLRHIADYGGDPKKVFLTGISGGGYLTAMIGLDPKWLAADNLRPTDLAGIAPLTGQVTEHFNVRAVGFDDPDPRYLPKINAWAPLAYAAKGGVPPSLFLTGGRNDNEIPGRVVENEMLATAMRALGNKRAFFRETEGDHGGGVTPSSFFLRDFMMSTVDADGVARFAPNDRVAFFGDSITHGGRYIGYLQLFAALRHPGWNVRCLNAGISGDSAGGAIARWDWDVRASKPTRVFVMFGMNDVGRSDYRSASPTAEEATHRAAHLKAYAQNQRKLVEMMAKDKVKTVMMSPSPYDQYSTVNTNNLVACNEPGLAACAQICRDLATEKHLGLVELFDPLTAQLKAHPELHLCGGDRVHPLAPGHLLMAALILDAMGEGPLVAQVAIDAAKGKIGKLADNLTRNAVVTSLAVATNGVSFTYAPKALPFPTLPEYAADDKIYPLTKLLNQETLKVTGLADGTYDLAFDGEKVGSFAAKALSKGVNISLLATPNQKRAREIAALVAELVDVENKLRMVTLNYVRFRRAGISLTDFAAQDSYWDKALADMKAQHSPWYQAHVHIAATYKAQRERIPELQRRSEDLYERINAVRPSVSRVSLLRTAAAPTCHWPKPPAIPREKGLYRSQVHRGGGSSTRPDNSLETFLWCWGNGLAPEADARLTKDGVAIACHDDNLKRVGRGISKQLASRSIRDLTWAEIRDVDTGSYLSPDYSTTRLATIESIFAVMKGRPERLLYVDEKGAPPELIADLARRFGVIEQVYFCSPDWHKVVAWRKVAPKGRSMVWLGTWPKGTTPEITARTEAFVQKRLDEMAATGFDGIDQVQIHVETDLKRFVAGEDPFCPSTPFMKKAIALMHRYGVTVNVGNWEGRTPAVYDKLWEIGFDHFTTDHPLVLIPVQKRLANTH